MHHNGLLLCLCVLFVNEAMSLVCPRTVTTHKATFTLSGNVIKDKNVQVPTYETVKECCTGYYKLNPRQEASSTNCLPLCKKKCKGAECIDKEQCTCPEKYVIDTTGTRCIPKCPPEHNFVDGGCRPKLNVTSFDNETEINQGPDIYNASMNLSDCSYSSSSTSMLYMSVGVNVIFFLIIIVLLTKIIFVKRKEGDRKSNDNMPECRNAQYKDMSGGHRNNQSINPDDPPQYEYIQENMSECPESQYIDMDGPNRNNPVQAQNFSSRRNSPYINMGGHRNNLVRESNQVGDAPCYEYVHTRMFCAEPCHVEHNGSSKLVLEYTRQSRK